MVLLDIVIEEFFSEFWCYWAFKVANSEAFYAGDTILSVHSSRMIFWVGEMETRVKLVFLLTVGICLMVLAFIY